MTAPSRTRRRTTVAVVLAAGILFAAACGDDDDAGGSATSAPAEQGSDTSAPAPVTTGDDAAVTTVGDTTAVTDAPAASSAPSSGETSLVDVCPDPVVVQTNWWPEPDHALFYQLIGPDGEVDTSTNTYSGPLGDTGVELQIRAGGPALGFQQVSAILAQDDDILLGLIGTDEQINNSAELATVSVLAWYQRSPQVFIWGNPDWNFEKISDIGESGATVLAFEGATYLDVFTGQGWLDPAQIDTSYQGGPSRFIAEDGNIVQQGFVTAEPYALENETPEWNRPVEYLLVADEYPVYQNSVAIRADKLDDNRDCLAALVPLLQQAGVDYANDPGPVNGALVEYVAQIDGGGFTLTEGGVADAAAKQVELGIIGNGPDGTFGSFDPVKLQTAIDQLVPVVTANGTTVKDGLVPEDLYTAEFIDSSISLDP